MNDADLTAAARAEALRPLTPAERVAAKSTVGYDVDGRARVLFLRVRGPLDISDTVVALPFAQLKHVVGQLVMQEGEQEGSGKLYLVSAEGVVKKS